MSVEEAARVLAERRAEIARKPIIDKCRDMRTKLGLPPHPGLTPPLILNLGDRL